MDSSGSALDSPPNVTIDVPAQVDCNAPTELEATVSDANSDLDSFEWRIEGYPLDKTVEEIQFTGTRELVAVARDARGATTTARKVVSCL